MVFVHLSDEEKLQVLLLAFGLFLLAALTSLCLAAASCPLNRWLLERHSRRRRRKSSLCHHHHHHQFAVATAKQQPTCRSTAHHRSPLPRPPGHSARYPGPPPAYEAALRAGRLSSLTSKQPPPPPPNQAAAEWLPAYQLGAGEKELDFGDYFHPPKEIDQHSVHTPPNWPQDEQEPTKQAPVMLRLWVRALEPGELVARVRQMSASRQDTGSLSAVSQAGESCRRLSRQLSIPHLFGSLVNLAGRLQTAGAAAGEEAGAVADPPEQQNSSSSSGNSSLEWPPSGGGGDLRPPKKEGEATSGPPSMGLCGGDGDEAKWRDNAWRANLSGAVSSPIMSRVLHMNVASFSYAKDESLISTKRHTQLNQQQLWPEATQAAAAAASSDGKSPGSKYCQLVVSICDIENVLRSSRQRQASCALLAASSSVHVQCEILAPESKSARLLRYPLRALQQETGGTHTVELATGEQKPPDGPTLRLSDSASVAPSSAGKSIVVFSSIPKQVEQQQQKPAGQPDNSSADLVQLDSVFVSPILSKSSLADALIRLRVYSQSKYVNETCLAELRLPLKQLLSSATNDNLAADNSQLANQQQADFILNNLLANLVTADTGAPLASLLEQLAAQAAGQPLGLDSAPAAAAPGPFRLPWRRPQTLAPPSEQADQLRSACSMGDSLHRLAELKRNSDDEWECRREHNYWRSLMVSHWLNYLVAPSYECRPVEEPRGSITLGLSYLPTSNRIIFNAHRASIDSDSFAGGKQLLKKLRLQSDTCYLLRLLMVANGRVVKRKQGPVGSRPEWDSQEPITFDLASVSVEQPAFVVALVLRNASLAGGGGGGLLQPTARVLVGCPQQQQQRAACARYVQSEPESLQHYAGAIYRHEPPGARLVAPCSCQRRGDLVIGHLTLGDEIWREMRAQPRKQIVKQFKMY